MPSTLASSSPLRKELSSGADDLSIEGEVATAELRSGCGRGFIFSVSVANCAFLLTLLVPGEFVPVVEVHRELASDK